MRKILILLRKELTEILRDKKTLIIMIVLPLIMYPLILIGVTLGISASLSTDEEIAYEAVEYAAIDTVDLNQGGTVAMILIMMITMGAFYPAVDVTTGEKERGTLETLLTLPVTNFQMIMSKYIAVSIMACITAVISIIALGASVVFLLIGAYSQVNFGIQIRAIPFLILVLMATALLISAICMSFCIFAKSSKEANNYMTPVMLLVMIASMAGVIPSIVLDYKTVLIPIVNVSLLIKQILSNDLDPLLASSTILVNAGASVIAIWIIARIYDSEDILFGDGFKSFKLFQKRSDIRKGTFPGIGDAILSLAVLLILMIYISVLVGTRSLFVGTLLTQLTILVIPLLIAWYMKSDVKSLFSLKAPNMRKAVLCILIYIGIYILVDVISVVLSMFMTESTANLEYSYSILMDNPFLGVTLVMAVMPAIGEELFFRGLVLGSFKHKYGPKVAIIASALIFGAYHMSLVKFIPTALLGLCFAYIVESSGSIYVSMILHFINNFIVIVAMK